MGHDSVDGVSYNVIDDLLYRDFIKFGVKYRTLAVPQSLREQVLSYAHEATLAGHSGYYKTLNRVQSKFSWPSMTVDIRKFVRSCHVCQIKAPVGRDKPAPFQRMPLIEEPFQRVVIDLVGPLPVTNDRYEYILTMVDMATRWAEATPLRKITADKVAEALFDMFSRVGFPKEIQSDRGQQFMSQLFQEFNSFSNIKHIFSTPYHPQTNGVVERFHSTLKNMLRKLAEQSPSDWSRYLSAALFAYRQQIHSSTGFSPFFLLYGRSPRGPMEILHDLYTNKDLSKDTSYEYHFVLDLHNRVKSACKAAQMSISQVATESIARQDKRSKLKVFLPGEKVLVLLPQSNNKLVLGLRGPFSVVKKQSHLVYLIDIDGRISPLHVNLLRKYHERLQTSQVTSQIDCTVSQTLVPNAHESNPCLFKEFPVHSKAEPYELVFTDDAIACAAGVVEDSGFEAECELKTPPTVDERSKVTINPMLDDKKIEQVNQILNEFSDVLTSLPGHTSTIQHEIHVKSDEVVRMKPYQLPFASQEFVKEEVQKLLDMGVVEPSVSPFSSPIVLVKKKDGSLRLCIDFRKLNAFTILDATNIPLPEDLFAQLSDSSIFSSCDLSKAYWQISVHPDSRHYTAFQTPLGLMQWTRMPFGLVNAPATFCRLMRIVLHDKPWLLSYFDDTLLHTRSWEDHITGLQMLLSTLREHGLTVNPSKLVIGQTSIQFLGHSVSNGTLAPVASQVSKVLDLKAPSTKKQVRSLMGLISYYRAFIPEFSAITSPLTDLLRKGSPEKVVWTPDCESALLSIQKLLTEDPVLIIPNLHDEFIVRTDASDYGIGAVLLQDRQGVLMPCRFASRKLLPRETNYSAIERECLAIVFAVNQFYKYLALKHFVLQTDHKPLLFLKRDRAKNSRLMRWALALQEFSFTLSAIPGRENCHADALSRLC